MRVQVNFTSLIAAGLFAAILGMQIPNLRSTIQGKANEQTTQLGLLEQFRANVERIQPVKEIFQSAFPPATEIQDLMALHRALNFAYVDLYVEKDNIVLRSVDRAVGVGGGSDLGLIRICIGSTGGELQASAPSMEKLLAGIAALSERRDIEVGSYSVLLDEKTGAAKALFTNFCLLARD